MILICTDPSVLRMTTNSYHNRSEHGNASEDARNPNFIYPCSPDYSYNCPVTVLALTITLLGVVGNLAVIITMVRQRRYRVTSHSCILVLAVNDLVSLLCNTSRECIYFPNQSYFVHTYGASSTFCITFFVVNYTPYQCSCWNVVFLAYERYVLMTRPLVYMHTHTPKLVIIRALVAFTITTLINLCYSIVMTNLSKCPEFILHPSYYALISVPSIFTSFVFLVFFHFSKVSKIRKMKLLEGRHTQIRKKFSRMTNIVYVIVIIYILSQIPYLLFDVVTTYETFTFKIWSLETFDIVLHVGIVVFLLNYAVNPFVYWITPLRCRFSRTPRRQIAYDISSIVD